MRPASGAEREVAAQEQRHISHVLYVVADEDIERGDRVEGAGLAVEVLGIREPSRAGHHWEIDCLEVQREESEAGS
jgi:head-tail adaptor